VAEEPLQVRDGVRLHCYQLGWGGGSRQIRGVCWVLRLRTVVLRLSGDAALQGVFPHKKAEGSGYRNDYFRAGRFCVYHHTDTQTDSCAEPRRRLAVRKLRQARLDVEAPLSNAAQTFYPLVIIIVLKCTSTLCIFVPCLQYTIHSHGIFTGIVSLIKTLVVGF